MGPSTCINHCAPYKGLVINYRERGGGIQNAKGGGGVCEVLPLQKREGGKSVSYAEGGAQKVLG